MSQNNREREIVDQAVSQVVVDAGYIVLSFCVLMPLTVWLWNAILG